MKDIGGVLWDAYFHALEKHVGRGRWSDTQALMEEVRKEAIDYLNDRGYSVGEFERSFLTICCSCRKVRDGNGCWKSIEDYMAENSRIEITHGLCSECAQGLLPEKRLDNTPHERP